MEEEDDNFILSSVTSTQVMTITQDAQSPGCYICKRNFRTNRGLLHHHLILVAERFGGSAGFNRWTNVI